MVPDPPPSPPPSPDPTILSTTIYHSLRDLAAAQLRERPARSLQPTALVHEAWLRIARLPERRGPLRAQFFALAGKAMRSVLVDHARRRLAEKRGGGRATTGDVDQVGIEVEGVDDVLALEDALVRLERKEPDLVEVVELMFYCGKTAAEAAELVGASSRTVERRWRLARAWLHGELGGARGGER